MFQACHLLLDQPPSNTHYSTRLYHLLFHPSQNGLLQHYHHVSTSSKRTTGPCVFFVTITLCFYHHSRKLRANFPSTSNHHNLLHRNNSNHIVQSNQSWSSPLSSTKTMSLSNKVSCQSRRWAGSLAFCVHDVQLPSVIILHSKTHGGSM